MIVVAGEIGKDDLVSKIKGILEKYPPVGHLYKKRIIQPFKEFFPGRKKDVATNYIHGLTGGPAPGTAEYNAFQLAMRIFSDRHFLDIRANNRPSYAPGGWFDGGAAPSATALPRSKYTLLKIIKPASNLTGFLNG